MNQQAAPDVGRRIRALREGQGSSLRALSERSGLSINAISLIERGENSPTVSSLHLLATALGVSISDLFQDEQEQTVVFMAPANRLRSESNGIRLESLGSGLPNQQLEPFLMHVAPGAGKMESPISHAGEEFAYCLEGEVAYRVGDETYVLPAGHSLLFEATQPHCFCNLTTTPALLMIVFLSGRTSPLARRLHMETLTQPGDSG